MMQRRTERGGGKVKVRRRVGKRRKRREGKAEKGERENA